MIIAFTGKRKSGKSFAARTLSTITDGRFKLLSFAGTLKDMFAAEYEIPREDLDDVTKKEQYRQSMQGYSLKYLLEDKMYFVKKLFEQVQPSDHVVVDDLRFIHELQAVLERGGKVYQMYSDPHVRAARGFVYDKVADTDISECDLDMSAETWHILGGSRIYNNKDEADLEFKLRVILKINSMDNEVSPSLFTSTIHELTGGESGTEALPGSILQ